MTQAPLTSYHGPQVFPSKDTTRHKKASSFTQQHPECYHQSTNKKTSQLLYYASPKIAQNDWKRHKAQATSQWRRRWSTNSPFLLHEQHLSTTMTCPLPKVVHSRDISYGHRPSKKGCSQRNLSPPNTLPRKMSAIITSKNTVEWANNEQPFFWRGPPKLVFTMSHLSTTNWRTRQRHPPPDHELI